MDDRDLIETEISSTEVYRGRLLHAFEDRVRLPDGKESSREFIRHPGAVLIIAVLDNGKFLFERQFRYPLRRVFLELPAGKIDPGEPHLDTARRELREETGYKAKTWRHLASMHPCIGYSDEHIEIFLAQGLTYVGHERDHNEFLEIVEMSLGDAISSVRDGEITDGKTIAGLFWTEKIFSGEWPVPT
jgi:ADP-ribose pyrophosphatase